MLIIYGEPDRAANSPAALPDAVRFSVPALYAAVPGPEKLMVSTAAATSGNRTVT
ncbi:hypothetical protein [Streptomyces coeruleorubidus]|uniref:hypothetical protein n=1 Tax=Streptomyces coeruleorubidus TaxID=116188 RepID=UPI0036687B2D